MSQVRCPVLAENHNNIITKDNIDSLLPSTYARVPGVRVSVSCYVPASFILSGPSQVVCGTNGQWSPSVPTCVRRSSGNNNNKNNGNNSGGTTEDNNISSTDAEDSSVLSDYSIIVIAVAAAFVAVLIIILIVFLCKHFSTNNKDDDEMKEPIHVQYIEAPPPRPQVAVVKVDNLFSPPSQEVVYKGPKAPPSWHSHPIIVMADQYKHRTWSQMSVDQYLREMDASRRENPNHSWRDFATISSYCSRSFSSIV